MGSLKKFFKKNKNLLLILVVVCFLMCLGRGGIIEGAREGRGKATKRQDTAKCGKECEKRKKRMKDAWAEGGQSAERLLR